MSLCTACQLELLTRLVTTQLGELEGVVGPDCHSLVLQQQQQPLLPAAALGWLVLMHREPLLYLHAWVTTIMV